MGGHGGDASLVVQPVGYTARRIMGKGIMGNFLLNN